MAFFVLLILVALFVVAGRMIYSSQKENVRTIGSVTLGVFLIFLVILSIIKFEVYHEHSPNNEYTVIVKENIWEMINTPVFKMPGDGTSFKEGKIVVTDNKTNEVLSEFDFYTKADVIWKYNEVWVCWSGFCESAKLPRNISSLENDLATKSTTSKTQQTTFIDTLQIDSITNQEQVISFDSVSNDLFQEALKELYTVFKYKSQSTEGERLYEDEMEEMEKLANSFERCAKKGRGRKEKCEIDFTLIKSVKSAYIKGEEPLEGHMYLKAHIQEWTFENLTTVESLDVAKMFEADLENCQSYRDCINKGGITWWRIGDKLYIIWTPAFRYAFEFDKIKEVLNRKLNY